MKKIGLLLVLMSLTACESLPGKEGLENLINKTPNLASINLEQPAEIEFVSPQDGATKVEGRTPLTFLWKSPVLALQNHQSAKAFLDKNLTLTPAHPGEWRSLGTSGIMFQPESPWPASTQFVLTPTPQLLRDFTYQFETSRVVLDRFEAQNLVGKNPLVLNFNQAVDLKRIEQNLQLLTAAGEEGLKVDVKYAMSTGDEAEKPTVIKSRIELLPQAAWSESQAYKLVIKPGAYGLEGPLPTAEPIEVEFKTQGPLTVTRKRVPQFHTDSMSLNFSAPVSSKVFAENLVITPEPETPLKEGVLQYFYDNEYDTTSFYVRPPDGAWDPEIEYTIDLKPDFKDKADRSLQNFEAFRFQTNLASFFNPVYFPQNFSVFERSISFKPTFAYGGKTERIKVTLNGSERVYEVGPSMKERKIWELDMAKDFPEIYGLNNQLKPGDYRLKVEAFFAEKNQSRTYETRFFVSDFSVEVKQSANDKVTVLAAAYPGDIALRGNFDMEVFVGDWREEKRFQFFEGVSARHTVEIPEDQFKLVRVVNGNKIGFGSPYFNQGMNVWDAQANFGDWKYSQKYSAALFTDRPLYKPGQQLYYKGFLRELELFGKNFPLKAVTSDSKALEYEMVIFDPEYEELDRFSGVLDQGSFDGTYSLPATAKLGNYRLVFNLQSEDGTQRFSTETPFWVQEYRKPNFLIASSFSDSKAMAEETLTAEIKAQYAFGGAIAERPVTYTVTLFGVEPCKFWCWGPQPRKDKVITRGEGVLDADGVLALPIDLTGLDLEDVHWNLLTLNATVNVSEAEQSSAELSVPFYQADRQLELDAIPHFAEAEASLKLAGTVTDLEPKAVANETVNLRLMQTKWVRNERKNADGNFYGEWESVEEELDSFKAKSDKNGRFEFELAAPLKGGEYVFEFQVADKKKRTQTIQKNFWVSGNELTQTRQNNTNKILWLFPSKDSYAIGETVEVFAPNADFKPTRVHATIERGEVLETLVFDTNNSTVSFEIEDWMSPNVFVSILMEGRDEAGNLKVKWGSHAIKVDDPSRSLSLEVTPEKSIYRPGDEVKLNLNTQVNNEGVSAEVAVAVVDQSLLALKARVPLDLLEILVGEWPLGVQTFHTLANYTSVEEMKVIMEEVQAIADRMEMGFGGGGGKGDDTKPRGDFRDTAAFISKFETEANGRGTVSFKLPDNLTTWNIFVAGATKNNAFGTQTTDFLVTLPLLVSEIVPNFLRAGDTVQMGLLVYRDDSELESENIKVSLNVPEDLAVIGDSEKTITVEKEARVFFEVAVQPTTETKELELGFTIEGEQSGLKDSVVLARTLQPTSQALSAAAFQRVEGAYDVKVLAAPEAISSELKVKIFASLADSLEALIDIAKMVNYGCTEQRLALLSTQLYQRNLEKALNRSTPPIDQASLASTRDQIEKSFTGEGFAFWEQSEQANFWVTTNVLEKAPLLAEYNVPLDETKLNRAAEWLEKELLKKCENYRTWHCPQDISRVHAAAVLVDYHLIDANDLTFLTNYTDSLEAKVWWLQTTRKLGVLPPALEATKETYFEAIIQAYNREDRYGFWTETKRAFYSQDERITALVLELLMDFGRFESEYETIARYLSDSRKSQLSGNSAMRVLKTLATYVETQESDSVGAKFTLRNETHDEVLLKGTLADLTQQQRYEGREGFETPQTISLNTDKPVLMDVTLTDSLPASAVVANARGFWIERTVTPLGAESVGVTDVETLDLGQNYEVKIKVVSAKPHRQVLVEDPIPSGTEIVNFDLDNADQTLRPEADEDCAWGWCQPLYQHKEMRADKARFFIDYLPAGTHEITYILQPRLAGEYEWLPARIEEMYYPEVAANTKGLQIEIKAQE